MKDVYQCLVPILLDTLPQRYPLNTESGMELQNPQTHFHARRSGIFYETETPAGNRRRGCGAPWRHARGARTEALCTCPKRG